MTNTFVDLNRTFTKIDSSSEFTYEKRHTFDNFFDFGNNITWDELINSDSINVILGEAGSGKTEEFKYQANKLYKNGYASFFIELEKLIDKSDPQAFDTEFERQLKEWKNETGNAYFFLDSIDESKFTKRSDFHNAIRNFKRLVGTNNLDRCKIILSSRHSEWHPETDVNIINELKRENKEQVKTEDNIDSLGNSKGIISFDDTVSNEDESENKIGLFRLNPLNSSQVELLSEQFLDENPQEFINAINIANVRSFAERPLDLKGLILIWKEKGKLGSFKEILDHHISNGIRETHFRQDKDILTPDRAKSGVKYLAAAVLLTKRQKICTIDSGKDAIVNAILPQVCLPGDWSDKEIKFLLQRRLFDEATFNTIKFHLRSTTEYLCALWFKDYLDRSDDYISVKDIFFNEDNSELILKDSYKPIVAWLSIGDRPWNERLRNDIINAFPELFLNYGDPSELSKNYLLDILDALRKKHGKSKFIYAEENVRSLSCIGKDEFVENFREWIRDQDIAEEFKRLLLSIALNSKMNGLSGLAKEIAISRDSHNRNRILSIHYLGEVESEKNLRSLKRFLFTEDNLSNSIIAASIEALYPDNLTNGELLTLLKKTNEIDEHALGIEYQLYRHIEFVGDSLSVNQLHTLIKI